MQKEEEVSYREELFIIWLVIPASCEGPTEGMGTRSVIEKICAKKNQITVDTEPRKTFHVPLADGPIKRTVKFSQLKCFFLYLSF